MPMKQPGKELPPMEQTADYLDSLVVFDAGTYDKMDTKFGKDQEIVKALVYVYLADGKPPTWKALGETPIFWKTVMKQIMEEAEGGPLGGWLRKGSDRNPNEWYIEPLDAKDKASAKLLDVWEKDRGDF